MAYSKDPNKYELGIVQTVAKAVAGEAVRFEFTETRHRDNARARIVGYIAAIKDVGADGWEAAQGVACVPEGNLGMIVVNRENTPFARLFDAAIVRDDDNEAEG